MNRKGEPEKRAHYDPRWPAAAGDRRDAWDDSSQESIQQSSKTLVGRGNDRKRAFNKSRLEKNGATDDLYQEAMSKLNDRIVKVQGPCPGQKRDWGEERFSSEHNAISKDLQKRGGKITKRTERPRGTIPGTRNKTFLWGPERRLGGGT